MVGFDAISKECSNLMSTIINQGCHQDFQVEYNKYGRWGIKQLGISFGFIFLLFSYESSYEKSPALPLNDSPDYLPKNIFCKLLQFKRKEMIKKKQCYVPMTLHKI